MTWTRGVCPYCGQNTEIRDDGFIAAHVVSYYHDRSFCAASNTFRTTWEKEKR